MTKVFNRSSETKLRQELRNSMPSAEVLLWSRLKGRQVLNCKFRRQYSVGPYVIDFYCPEHKLGVEIDGDSHFQEGARENDQKRQQFIESFGIRILRYLNTDVYENLDEVVAAIAQAITPPAPPC